MNANDETNAVAITNKIINLTNEIDILYGTLEEVYKVMSDDIPDNDLHQNQLEELIFTAKKKVKDAQLQMEQYAVLDRSRVSEKIYNLNNEARNKIFNVLSQTEWLVKRVTTVSMKWEVGASEVIKGIRKKVLENERKISGIHKKLNEISDGVIGYFELNSKTCYELEQKIDEMGEQIKTMMTLLVTKSELDKKVNEIREVINDKGETIKFKRYN